MDKPLDGQWNAGHYDSNIGYVSRLGKGVVELLAPQSHEKIVDLGCGTGDLAAIISQSGADCLGIDGSMEMINQAKAKYPSLSFMVADAHTFRIEKRVDAVFSNAALHWMTEPERVIQSVRLALHDSGRFVAEFGGKGNIGAIYEAIAAVLQAYGMDAKARFPWYFPTISEYSSLLEKDGFEVRFMELYDRPTPLDGGIAGLRNWLEAFAGMFFVGLDSNEKEEAYSRCEELLQKQLFDGERWIADYRRLRFSAVATSLS
ncbi:class I SAM-dependent methyltransferase [Paenibacillus agricola]|uniref:Methyltransferase domain-containing protein n=1 Tax=Paenibacillus agricola TaxID=2716264 RepID=A0ABX0IYZ9_9BACL|nr:methyltransferase domain-containing protein [Paenibacillus agricola]NHN29195.1 methyltransferase domain-containing protein [Paenibacillus agricola]